MQGVARFGAVLCSAAVACHRQRLASSLILASFLSFCGVVTRVQFCYVPLLSFLSETGRGGARDGLVFFCFEGGRGWDSFGWG